MILYIATKLHTLVIIVITGLVYIAVLEIIVGHRPFSDQFQRLADQNPFWSAIFPVHFQWDNNQ